MRISDWSSDVCSSDLSEQPVSTFYIDVETGSYANVRRMLPDGARPPAEAVRAEEMINYFRYGHPAPVSLDVPFRVTPELATAPWNGKRQLLKIDRKNVVKSMNGAGGLNHGSLLLH